MRNKKNDLKKLPQKRKQCKYCKIESDSDIKTV